MVLLFEVAKIAQLVLKEAEFGHPERTQHSQTAYKTFNFVIKLILRFKVGKLG